MEEVQGHKAGGTGQSSSRLTMAKDWGNLGPFAESLQDCLCWAYLCSMAEKQEELALHAFILSISPLTLMVAVQQAERDDAILSADTQPAQQ